jgi:hypothetical protein
MIGSFENTMTTTLGSRTKALEHPTTVDKNLLDVEFRRFKTEVLVFAFPVGNSRHQKLFEAGRSLLFGKLQ